MTNNTEKFVHPHPIRKDEIDSTVLVRIIDEDYANQYEFEEIPAERIERNHYRLCASPLLVRDLNLDDIVMADDQGIFVNLVKDKGKFGFRVGMHIHYEDHDEISKYEKVIEELEKLKCDIEYYSHHLVGIVANNRWKARKVQNKLLKLQEQGLILGIETNRS